MIDRSLTYSGIQSAHGLGGSLERSDRGRGRDFLAEGAFARSWWAMAFRLATLPVGKGIDSPYPFALLLPQSAPKLYATPRDSRRVWNAASNC